MKVTWLGATLEVIGDGDGPDLEATHTTIGVALSILGKHIILLTEFLCVLISQSTDACNIRCRTGGSRQGKLLLHIKQHLKLGLGQSLRWSPVLIEVLDELTPVLHWSLSLDLLQLLEHFSLVLIGLGFPLAVSFRCLGVFRLTLHQLHNRGLWCLNNVDSLWPSLTIGTRRQFWRYWNI